MLKAIMQICSKANKPVPIRTLEIKETARDLKDAAGNTTVV